MNRQNKIGIPAIIGFVVSGILLLACPHLMGVLTVWLIGLALCAIGVWNLIGYFKSSPAEGAMSFRFAGALLALALGILIIADQSLLGSILPRLWGVLLLMGGFVKAQNAMDAFRMKASGWFWFLIGAAISVILGLIAIQHPAFIMGSLSVYLGISLLVEAVIDCAMLFIAKKHV